MKDHEPYTIPQNVFDHLRNRQTFSKLVGCELYAAIEHASSGSLYASISPSQLEESYWVFMERVDHIEAHLLQGNQASHLKLSAALFSAVMSRRPIYSITWDGPVPPEGKNNEFIMLNANEFAVFDLVYRICCAYESTDDVSGMIINGKSFSVSREYVEVICSAAKTDYISSQSMYLILKALFEQVVINK